MSEIIRTVQGKRITNYKVVEKSDLYALENEVRNLIYQGWQPYGSVIIHITGTSVSSSYKTNSYMYLQPMVQYEQIIMEQHSGSIDKNVLIDFLENYGK